MHVVLGGFLVLVVMVAIVSRFLTRYAWWYRGHWLINGPLLAAVVGCVLYGLSLGASTGSGLLMFGYAFAFAILSVACLRPVLSRPIFEGGLSGAHDSPSPSESAGRAASSELGQADVEDYAWRMIGRRRKSKDEPWIALNKTHVTLDLHDIEFVSNSVNRLLVMVATRSETRNVPLEAITGAEYINLISSRLGGDHFCLHVADGYFRIRQYDYPDFHHLPHRLAFLPKETASRAKKDLEKQDIALALVVLLLMAGLCVVSLRAFS